MTPNYLLNKDFFQHLFDGVVEKIEFNKDYPMSEKSIELRGNKSVLDYLIDQFKEIPEVEEKPIIICKKIMDNVTGISYEEYYKFDSQQEVIEAFQLRMTYLDGIENVYGRKAQSYEMNHEDLTLSYGNSDYSHDYFPVNKFSPLDNF
jgi:hypothetical protein